MNTLATLVPDRRYFDHVAEWRVGQSASIYGYVGEASGIGPIEWWETPVDVRLTIPGAANAVRQQILNPDIEGFFHIRDYEAVTVLLYETDIDASSNKAVTSTGRNTITYFVLIINNTKVTNSDNSRTAETSTFSFTNARIGRIVKRFDEVASYWIVPFTADSVTQTDA